MLSQSLYIALKKLNPDRAIDVIAPQWSRPILARMPQVSSFIDLPFGHRELALLGRYRIAATLRDRYQQAIVLPNSFKSALIPYWAKIPQRTGFKGEMRFGLINDMRPLDCQHLPRTVDRMVELGKPDCDAASSAVANPVLQVDHDNAQQCAQRMDLHFEKPILALMPGSAFGKSKHWPADYFSDIATRYIQDGWQVWVFGSAADVPAANRIVETTYSEDVLNLCGKTSLIEAVDLIAQSKLALSNDSGLMHIAAAVGVPVVAVYGATSPALTPPMSSQSLTLWKGIFCSPCYKPKCRYNHYRCLTEISPNQVYDATKRLLGSL